MARMNGGLAARGRQRPPTRRQEEIARVGRSARGGGQGPGQIRRLPGGNLPQTGMTPGLGGGRPQRGVGAQGNGQGATRGKGVGVGNAVMPGPGGAQLARRVASGAITQEQAQRTMGERRSLRKAFGPDFREKFGGVGAFREARQKLADNPNNPTLIALNQRLQAKRSRLVEAARKKIGGEGGNGGTAAPAPGRRRAVGRRRRAY